MTTDQLQTATYSGEVAVRRRRGWWWKTLLVGLLLWAATVGVTFLTLNVNLVPTVILLGSLLVPFSAALFVAERVQGLGVGAIPVTFAIAGICGVLGASLLESNLAATPWIYVLVGFIEEFVKLVLLVIVGWRVVPKSAIQGVLLGVVVGAGFAGFESAGYAFTAAITSDGIDVLGAVQTEAIRALLSPVGHMLWTGIVGAALFGVAAGRARFRFSPLILVAFVGASLLHALWDSLGTISSYLALLVSGMALFDLQYRGGLPPDLAADVTMRSLIFYIIGLVIASALGVGALLVQLRVHRTP